MATIKIPNGIGGLPKGLAGGFGRSGHMVGASGGRHCELVTVMVDSLVKIDYNVPPKKEIRRICTKGTKMVLLILSAVPLSLGTS